MKRGRPFGNEEEEDGDAVGMSEDEGSEFCDDDRDGDYCDDDCDGDVGPRTDRKGKEKANTSERDEEDSHHHHHQQQRQRHHQLQHATAFSTSLRLARQVDRESMDAEGHEPPSSVAVATAVVGSHGPPSMDRESMRPQSLGATTSSSSSTIIDGRVSRKRSMPEPASHANAWSSGGGAVRIINADTHESAAVSLRRGIYQFIYTGRREREGLRNVQVFLAGLGFDMVNYLRRHHFTGYDRMLEAIREAHEGEAYGTDGDDDDDDDEDDEPRAIDLDDPESVHRCLAPRWQAMICFRDCWKRAASELEHLELCRAVCKLCEDTIAWYVSLDAGDFDPMPPAPPGTGLVARMTREWSGVADLVHQFLHLDYMEQRHLMEPTSERTLHWMCTLKLHVVARWTVLGRDARTVHDVAGPGNGGAAADSATFSYSSGEWIEQLAVPDRTKPVLRYRASEVVQMVESLVGAWKGITPCAEAEALVDLLRLRFAALCSFVYTDDDRTLDVEEMREAVPCHPSLGGTGHVASFRFIELMEIHFNALGASFFVGVLLGRCSVARALAPSCWAFAQPFDARRVAQLVSVDKDEGQRFDRHLAGGDRERARVESILRRRAIRKAILAWCSSYVSCSHRKFFILENFQEVCLGRLLHPGEIERYKLENPFREINAQNALSRTRPGDMKRYDMEYMRRPLDVLTRRDDGSDEADADVIAGKGGDKGDTMNNDADDEEATAVLRGPSRQSYHEPEKTAQDDSFTGLWEDENDGVNDEGPSVFEQLLAMSDAGGDAEPDKATAMANGGVLSLGAMGVKMEGLDICKDEIFLISINYYFQENLCDVTESFTDFPFLMRPEDGCCDSISPEHVIGRVTSRGLRLPFIVQAMGGYAVVNPAVLNRATMTPYMDVTAAILEWTHIMARVIDDPASRAPFAKLEAMFEDVLASFGLERPKSATASDHEDSGRRHGRRGAPAANVWDVRAKVVDMPWGAKSSSRVKRSLFREFESDYK